MAKKKKIIAAAPGDERRTRSRKPLAKLMDNASEALAAGRYFECERLANEALHAALQLGDFDLIARVALPLQEARRQRRLLAADTGALFEIDDDANRPDARRPPEPGVYLFGPPLVAADARATAERGLTEQVPVIAIAREPVTRLNQTPVVVFGPATIRAKVPVPRSVSIEWVLDAIDELTSAALDSLDAGRSADRQLTDCIDFLDTLPESELLHQRVAQLARQAQREVGMAAPAGATCSTVAALDDDD